MTASFTLSVIACIDILRNGPIDITLYQFVRLGTLAVDVSLYFDRLSILLLLLVTGISLLVYMYSSRYMQGDARHAKFFGLITLFTFSMIMVVLSNNLFSLFVFWEIMSICSYFLIGFWSERPAAIRAATKAFLVNAFADIGLFFGIVLTFTTFETLHIRQIISLAPEVSTQTINLASSFGGEWHVSVLTIICFFLFVGAMGKSAQFPFHGWLPSAMEAPTPVSALIHAATMVNAGVYLIIRLSPMFSLTPSVLTFIAFVGGITALVAAIVALTQTDIKRILAFSTISQLGFMMFACGVGAFMAATFHLLSHGAFKAYLFLSTGDTVQLSERHYETNDATKPPWHLSFQALVLALIPPVILFAGPYEKLWAVNFSDPAGMAFLFLTGITVFFTAYYLYQLITSISENPVSREWIALSHDMSPAPKMMSVKAILTILSAIMGSGIVLALAWNGVSEILTPVLSSQTANSVGAIHFTTSLLWLGIGVGAAAAGWGAAYYFNTTRDKKTEWLADLLKTTYVLCLNRLYIDEIYNTIIVKPTLRFSHWLMQVIEGQGINRATDGVGEETSHAAKILCKIDYSLMKHQMMLLVFWLTVAVVCFYFMIL